jgi:hypothetical protein
MTLNKTTLQQNDTQLTTPLKIPPHNDTHQNDTA